MHRLVTIAFALALATGCGFFGGDDQEGATDAAPAVDVTRIAEIARKIKEEPARGDAILQESGMTRKELEDALFVIASDPALSAEYEKLFR